MIRTASFDDVDGHILSEFTRLVHELGRDPDPLLRATGIDPSAFRAGVYKANYRQMVLLVARAAQELRCPDFGMRLAVAQHEGIHSPLLKLIESCPSLGDALAQVCAHSYAHSPAVSIWFRPSVEEESVTFGHDILLDGLPQRAQAMEQILLVAYLLIRRVMGGRIRARHICFRHQPISPLRSYRRYFGCEVRFGQYEDAIVFHQRDMSCPTLKPDEQALTAALAFIEAQGFSRPPLHASVRGLVMNLLGTARCRNEYAADMLRLHVRAMHRQLAAEGTSFQRIKNEVRRDLALYYLELTRLDLTIISERLGFAEQSALTRFCRKWLGAAPSAIRSCAPPDGGNNGRIVQNGQV